MNPDVTSDTQEWHARKRKNQTDANQQRQGDLDRIKSIVELERKIHYSSSIMVYSRETTDWFDEFLG